MDYALNWIWQGSVVAAAASVILRLLSRARAQFRYALCWVVLAIVLTLPIVPVLSPLSAASETPATGPASAAEVILTVPNAWWTSTTVVLSLWTVWFGVFTLRLTSALVTTRRARRRCQPFPEVVESGLECWNSVRMRGRPTHLVCSEDVRAAAILGCGSPVIAVTPALLVHLDAGELDRVVVHEWAHVQRRDDLLNVAQLATRAIAGWHPAVWWLNRQLQIEREAACDETTVALTGSAKCYAASLAKTASLAPGRQSVPALGVLSSPGLRTRVVRVLGYGRLVSKSRSVGASLAGAGSVLGLAVCIAGLRLIGTAAPAAPFEPGLSGALATVDWPGESMASAPTRPLASAQKPPSELTGLQDSASATAARRGAPPLIDTVAGTQVDLLPVAADLPSPAINNEPASSSITIPTVPVAPADGVPAVNTVALGVPPAADASAAERTNPPWTTAADTGASVGRASRKAAVATAGFFTRLGKKIAGSF